MNELHSQTAATAVELQLFLGQHLVLLCSAVNREQEDTSSSPTVVVAMLEPGQIRLISRRTITTRTTSYLSCCYCLVHKSCIFWVITSGPRVASPFLQLEPNAAVRCCLVMRHSFWSNTYRSLFGICLGHDLALLLLLFLLSKKYSPII